MSRRNSAELQSRHGPDSAVPRGAGRARGRGEPGQRLQSRSSGLSERVALRGGTVLNFIPTPTHETPPGRPNHRDPSFRLPPARPAIIPRVPRGPGAPSSPPGPRGAASSPPRSPRPRGSGHTRFPKQPRGSAGTPAAPSHLLKPKAFVASLEFPLLGGHSRAWVPRAWVEAPGGPLQRGMRGQSRPAPLPFPAGRAP